MIHELPITRGGEPEKERVGAVMSGAVVSEAAEVSEVADVEGETADGCCRGSKS